MYRAYEENEYFRCMPLPYEYLCFYRVEDEIETIRIIIGGFEYERTHYWAGQSSGELI